MLSNLDEQSLEQSTLAYLEARRGKIISRTGGWLPGKGVFSHGFSMLEELVGEKSYFQILILNATGRLVERRLADWLEAIYGCLSWPDPRIWCNQIGALAGAAKASVVAGTSLGCLASDSRTYGVFPLIEGAEFILRAKALADTGLSAEEIVQKEVTASGGKPHIVGYVRPIAKGDERLEVMERVGRRLGFEPGAHLQLAYEIERVLLHTYDEGMNINGYMSAFLADQGFTPQECYRMHTLLVASGVTACYLDTYACPPDSFLPLRCSDIEYQGTAPRPVPPREL